jgi:predicted AlkP superfamily phosphohydrolase/phosphomutase
VVGEIYIQLDRYLGELLDLVPDDATVVVISDHGMRPLDNAGYHAPHGILVARGDGIRQNAKIHGASVLDIAPTLLHLFGAPIPHDMDGKLLPQLFDRQWLVSHLPRYVEMDTSRSIGEKALTEGRDEIMEELRALGYIQ